MPLNSTGHPQTQRQHPLEWLPISGGDDDDNYGPVYSFDPMDVPGFDAGLVPAGQAMARAFWEASNRSTWSCYGNLLGDAIKAFMCLAVACGKEPHLLFDIAYWGLEIVLPEPPPHPTRTSSRDSAVGDGEIRDAAQSPAMPGDSEHPSNDERQHPLHWLPIEEEEDDGPDYPLDIADNCLRVQELAPDGAAMLHALWAQAHDPWDCYAHFLRFAAKALMSFAVTCGKDPSELFHEAYDELESELPDLPPRPFRTHRRDYP